MFYFACSETTDMIRETKQRFAKERVEPPAAKIDAKYLPHLRDAKPFDLGARTNENRRMLIRHELLGAA